MRVLVYSHKLTVGGSSLVALDLAAAVSRAGHEVTVFGPAGPLAARVGELGMAFEEAPRTGDGREHDVAGPLWPSPRIARRLRRVVAERGIDVVHTYEWYPCVEAFAALRACGRTPVVSTILAMRVPWHLPRSLPLVVGTGALRRAVAARRTGAVRLIEPTVDLAHERGARPQAFLAAHGLDDGIPNVVLVTRLEGQKLDGALDAVAAVERLAPTRPVRLVVVGGGSGLAELRARAEAIEARWRRRLVVATGASDDPRPAYAAADVVLGMGGSVIRGMAHGRPAVVLGAGGFARLVTPAAVASFREHGYFGAAEGGAPGERLAAVLRGLVDDPCRAASLGAFARRHVEDHHDVDAAAGALVDLYESAAAERRRRDRDVLEALRTAALLVRLKAAARRRGLAGAPRPWRGSPA